MERLPKLKLKKMVLVKLNPRNLMGLNEDTYNFYDDTLYYLGELIDPLKKENLHNKCHGLCFSLELTVGYIINREYLEDLLVYLKIPKEYFYEFCIKLKKEKDLCLPFLDWYEKIDKDAFCGDGEDD